MPIDRKIIAESMGYNSIFDMYNDLYNKRFFSARKIEKKIGINNTTVLNDLRKLNIKIRGKGGFNFPVEKSVLDKISCIPLKILKNSSYCDISRMITKDNNCNLHDKVRFYLIRELGIFKKRTYKLKNRSKP